ncbi:MAG: hypothetical protein H8E42_03415 [Nitrospinae bacterium]|nr:hypothetical protein [Nitrospinota bacterium]MBL7020188.1 hypothetical protein [Nitrospinaceae bacterium]
MTYNYPFSDGVFSQGHKTLTWGTFVFGGVLFLLAVLIFAYPALIAYFFAGIILLAGITALAVAWKLWRFRENVSRFEPWENLGSNNSGYRTRVTHFRWRA